MMWASATLDRLRQPEYTGENRCIPCTAVNAAIAIVIGAGIAWISLPVGIVFLTLAFGAIALRGYLVPGTPELTKYYLPSRIHRWFHRAQIPNGDEEALEFTLTEWGVLEPCADVDDLCLVPSIEEQLLEEVESIRDETLDGEHLAPLLEADPGDIRIRMRPHPVVHLKSRRSRWPSRSALLADIAMSRVLSEQVPGWEETATEQRGPILAGLRSFVEECPACAGDIQFDEAVVESCCHRRDVVRLRCDDCESTLFEIEASSLPAA